MDRETLKSILRTYTIQDLEKLHIAYCDYLNDDYILTRDLFHGAKSIVVYIFRLNEYISFNDMIRNNDLLLVSQNTLQHGETGNTNHLYNCTVDPSTHANNIAHICSQIYVGNRGWHRWNPLRPCIRSDKGCWYFRTNTKKQEVQSNTFGAIGLNIHNRNKLFNSSKGCPILESDDEYEYGFKPILATISNPKNITVSVMNLKFIDQYFTRLES